MHKLKKSDLKVLKAYLRDARIQLRKASEFAKDLKLPTFSESFTEYEELILVDEGHIEVLLDTAEVE